MRKAIVAALLAVAALMIALAVSAQGGADFVFQSPVQIGQGMIYAPDIVDIDGDGRPEIYLSNHGHGVQMLRRQPDGQYVDVIGATGIATDGDTHGTAWGDCDGDGDLDLYQAMGAELGTIAKANRLYINSGGIFTDTAIIAGVDDPYGRGRWPSWQDWDNDGDLDLWVTNAWHSELRTGDQLFENDGTCHFTNVTTQTGVTGAYYRGIAWADYDSDGYPDAYTVGYRVRLWRNNGDGTFTNVTAAVGLYDDLDIGNGGCWGDYDGDGDPDLYALRGYPLAQTGPAQPNTLWRNISGTFTATNIAASIANSRGCTWVDYDDDGDLDLHVVNAGDYTIDDEPDELWRNDGGTLMLTNELRGPLHIGHGQGAAWGDIDGDGRIDVLVTNGAGPLEESEFAPKMIYYQRDIRRLYMPMWGILR